MLSVTIDAGVLAVPHVGCGKDEVSKYVHTLLDLNKLLEEHWIDIHMSEQSCDALVADGLYPIRAHIKEVFNIHGIEEYDANTVAKISDKILVSTTNFETYYQIKEVLYEKLDTEPDISSLIPHKGIQANLERCITLITILCKHCSQHLDAHTLILREAPSSVIHVRTHIYEIEHTRDDVQDLPTPPEFLEGDVRVCDDFRSLIDCLDEFAILADAPDNFGIELAIRIALFKKESPQGNSSDWEKVNVPTIGASFHEMCQQVCAAQGTSVPPKILRAIVETIRGHNLQAVHALRTGSGGNDPQRMRGGDKAQRRDIDTELHLHYWECADGTIELASVVYHNDFSIPE